MLKPMIATQKGRALPATYIPQNKKKKFHYLTPDQLRRIIDNAPNFRAKVAIMTMVCTGARVTELRMLKPSSFKSIKFMGGVRYVVHIPTLKQRQEEPPDRTVPIPPQLYDLVQQYAYAYKIGEKSLLFPVSRKTVWEWVKRAAKQAGLSEDDVRPHTFRHTFAMICVWCGAPPGH